jgi:hypothetical protein
MRTLALAGLISLGALAQAVAQPLPAFSAAEKIAIFKAAGFKLEGKNYTRCEDDPSMSHMFGYIEAEDLNGDGKAEAWVKESSSFCYGNTAESAVLVSKGADGSWKVLLDEVGVPIAQKTKHLGWADITVGGPGFGKPPLFVFNGKAYARQK